MGSDVSCQPTFASFYDFYDSPDHRQDQLQVYCTLASEGGDPILELACGTGIIATELARAGLDVTGLDISSDMLQVAQEKMYWLSHLSKVSKAAGGSLDCIISIHAHATICSQVSWLSSRSSQESRTARLS